MNEGMDFDAPTDNYHTALREAAEAFLLEGLEAGRLVLVPIAGHIWPGLPSGAIMRAKQITPTKIKVGKRSFSAERSAKTFLRDKFRCRYCGCEIIPKPIAILMSGLYSQELPFHPNYKSGFVHSLYWTRVAEADHLVAGSVGGDWNDPDNHVTACVVCNTRKGNCSIEDIGWELITPVDGWDGLTSLYSPILEQLGRSKDKYHLPWLRVFQVYNSTDIQPVSA